MKRKHLILILLCDVLLIVGALYWLTGCGIQRPLMRPKDIPAYEQKRQDKLERRRQDMEDFDRQQQLEEERFAPPQV